MMGWGDVISIGLGLGNMAINTSNSDRLQQLQMQTLGEAFHREYINALRNNVFHMRQTAEGILASESAEPLKSAGAMRILNHYLTVSVLTPSLFPEFSDKDYVISVLKLIGENSNRMYASLDNSKRAKVDQLVDHVNRLSDYQYYLENLEEGEALIDANMVVDGAISSRPLLLIFAGGGITLLLITTLMEESLGKTLFAMAALFLIAIALLFAIADRRVSRAQKTVENLGETIDVERFIALDDEFESPDSVEEMRVEAEEYIEEFFGDYTLFSEDWRSE